MIENVKVRPWKLGPSELCDKYIELRGDEISHETIKSFLEHLQTHLPSHSEPENLTFYLLKDEEGYVQPRYNLLVFHNHFEYGLDLTTMAFLTSALHILNEVADVCTGQTQVILLHEAAQKLMIRVDELSDINLVEEFVANNDNIWFTENMEEE